MGRARGCTCEVRDQPGEGAAGAQVALHLAFQLQITHGRLELVRLQIKNLENYVEMSEI